MLEFFRKATKTWAARVFFILLGVTFAFLWGGQDGLRMIGLSQDSTVAKVGNKKITTQELAGAINRAASLIQFNTGQRLTEKDFERLGLARQVLETLIVDYLVQAEANHLGIAVSDEFIAHLIRTQPTFQTPDGKFSRDLFNQFLHALQFSHERDYVAFMKRDVLKQRLISLLTGAASLPLVSVNPLYAWNEQVRNAKGIVIEPALLPLKNDASEDDLRNYYGKNRNHFIQPEQRSFHALVLDTTAFQAHAKSLVTADVIQALYDVEKNKKYKDVPEKKAKKAIKKQLLIEYIQDQALEEGRKIQEDYESGMSLEDLATKYPIKMMSFKEKRLQEAQDAQKKTLHDTAAVKQDYLMPTLIQRAFQNDENTLSSIEQADLDNGEKAYFLLQVTEIQPKKHLNFKDALPQVKKAYQKAMQFEAAKALVEKIEKQLDAGEFFDTVAAQHHLKVIKMRVSRQESLAPTPFKLDAFSVTRLFSVPQKGITQLQTRTPEGKDIIIIAKIDSIKQGKPQAGSEALKLFSDSINEQLKVDIAELYLGYLRQKHPVEINSKFFKQ